MLFSSACGGIGGTVYKAVLNKRLIPFTAATAFRPSVGYAILLFLVVAVTLVHQFTDWPVVLCGLAISLVGFVYGFMVRRDLLVAGLTAGLLFMLVYILTLLLVQQLDPGFVREQWNTEALLGITLLAIPFEEYVNAFMLGAACSGIYEAMYA